MIRYHKTLSMKLVSLFFSLLLVFSLSCHKKTEDQVKPKTILQTAFPFDPSTLDPRRGSDPIASEIHFMLFEGLTKMSRASTRELGMASAIDISDDGLVYTFSLRKAKWSDGSPVTAHDFAYAWSSILDPNFPAPNAQLLYPIKNATKVKKGELPLSSLGLKAINEETLEVTLEAPTPYFLDVTSFCVLFPVPHKIASRNPHWADRIGPDFVTNGPFLLQSWQMNNEYLFAKNPLYWDKEHIALDGIHASIIPDDHTMIALFKKGELDFIGATGKFSQDELTLLKNDRGLHHSPVGASLFLTFQMNDALLQNEHLRKALSLSIDRKNLVEHATLGSNQTAYGCIPPILKEGIEEYFVPNQNTLLAQEHFEKAKEELGLSSSLPTFTLLYSSSPLNKQIVQILQDEWRKVLGIHVLAEEHDFKIVMDKLNRKDFQIGLIEWVVQYNDPMNIFDRFKFKTNLKNYSGWENKEYISLLDLSAYAKNKEERFSLLKKAEEIFTREYPILCLFHFDKVYLQSDRVEGMYISPIGSIHYNEATMQVVKH